MSAESPRDPQHQHAADAHAATVLWEPLAAFAWAHYEVGDRGAVLVTRRELHEAAADHEAGRALRLQPTYLLAEHIPKGEDFRPVLLEYDPQKEIVLIVGEPGDPEGSETLLRIAAAEGRPAPPTCCERMRAERP